MCLAETKDKTLETPYLLPLPAPKANLLWPWGLGWEQGLSETSGGLPSRFDKSGWGRAPVVRAFGRAHRYPVGSGQCPEPPSPSSPC